MSYLAGLGLGFGVDARPPTITCDSVGCDARITIEGLAPRWFLDNKPKRGWALIKDEAGRRDYCPQHAPAPRTEPSR